MPSEVNFTRAQKWDLVRISAAAVASMVFFTVPMFLVHPQEAASQAGDRQLPPIALAGMSQAPAARAGEASSAPSKSSPQTATVSVVRSTEFAVVTAPLLQSSTTAVRTRTSKPAQIRARANTPAPTSSFSRRVARFIAGSGKYDVRPFPTVTTSGS
jgi:hypothetical protein